MNKPFHFSMLPRGMTWREAFTHLLVLALLAIVFGSMMFADCSGSHPPLLFNSGLGIFTRNDCGTYDRYITWGNGLHMPNGILGRPRGDCK